MSKIKEAAILKIVTHPGRAHRDEFLAIAIVLASLPAAQMRQVAIERRQPKREDTLDKGVLVLDIGGGEFDHHQLSPEAPATCALTLVLKDLGLLEQAREVWSWLEFVEVMDSKGPGAVASRAGVPWDKLSGLTMNPVEMWALHWFANNPDNMKDVLNGVGARLLSELADYRSALTLLDAHAHVVFVRGVALLDLTFTSDTTAVNKWRMQHCPHAKGSIMKDDRGGGYTLYAWQMGGGSGWLDFRRLAHPGITFIHNGGFLAKTRMTVTFREVLDLLTQALPSEPVCLGSMVGNGFSVQGSWQPAPTDDGSHFVMVTIGTAKHGCVEGMLCFRTEAALRSAMSHVRNRIEISLSKGEVAHA